MSDVLTIPHLEEKIAWMQAQLDRLYEERRHRHPSMYICDRCGALFQSMHGCGCAIPLYYIPKELSAEGKKSSEKPSHE